MDKKIAFIIDYVDYMTEQIVLDPLRKSVCPFDVVSITGDLSSYPIWISPIPLDENRCMYEITLIGSAFDQAQIQVFLDSIKEPLAFDPRNKISQILGNYSIVITTSDTDGKWPGLGAVLKWVATLL